MADTSGMAEIRGIDIDKLAKGFAEQETIFKKYVTNSTTSAREIRWYQKTSGFLESTDTSGITANQIANVAFNTLPVVVEQSWTRNTSYVRKYFVTSPMISDEDVRDSDIDVLATNVRDLTRAVEYAVDKRIWDVLTESQAWFPTNINYVNCSGAWTGDAYPINDIMNAQTKIRQAGYNPNGGVLILNASGAKNLLTWLISVKGSSIPSFASQKVESGVLTEILGLRVITSENVTSGWGLIGNTERAATWKSFSPLSAVKIEEPLIGIRIRISEEGECLLTDPKAVCILSGCGTT